jgi:hypothetical protein
MSTVKLGMLQVLGGLSLLEGGGLCRHGDHDDYSCFGG